MPVGWSTPRELQFSRSTTPESIDHKNSSGAATDRMSSALFVAAPVGIWRHVGHFCVRAASELRFQKGDALESTRQNIALTRSSLGRLFRLVR